MRIIALFLLMFSLPAYSSVTFTWVNATTDINNVPIQPQYISAINIYCGTQPGTYNPAVVVNSVNLIPATAYTFNTVPPADTVWYCAMSTMAYVQDALGNMLPGNEGPLSAELSFDPNTPTQKTLIGAPSIFTVIVTP